MKFETKKVEKNQKVEVTFKKDCRFLGEVRSKGSKTKVCKTHRDNLRRLELIN